MNRNWILIRRLRGPAFLLLFGVTALLNQHHILSFGQSWPFYLILGGVLALAERAAFRPEPPPYPGPYAGASRSGFTAGYASAPPTEPTSALTVQPNSGAVTRREGEL